MNPTFAGFLSFVRNQAGVPATALPDTSAYLVWCYNIAVETTNSTLPGTIYALALYNLAMSNLLNFAEDVPGSNFFAQLRAKLNIDGPVLGPVTSTSDEGTSVSVEAPEFFKYLSLEELQQLRDPFGRRYLMLAQKAGSSWGLNGGDCGHRAALYVPPVVQNLVLSPQLTTVQTFGAPSLLIVTPYRAPTTTVMSAGGATVALILGQIAANVARRQVLTLAASVSSVAATAAQTSFNHTTAHGIIFSAPTAVVTITSGAVTFRRTINLGALIATVAIAPKSTVLARAINMIVTSATVVTNAGSATLLRSSSTPGGGANNTADHSDPNNAYLQALMAA